LFGGGGNPDGGLIQATDLKLYGVTAGGPGKEDGIVYYITSCGTFTTLHGGGGQYSGELVQGTDGNFYRTVLEGGAFNHGTVFKITPSGTLMKEIFMNRLQSTNQIVNNATEVKLFRPVPSSTT